MPFPSSGVYCNWEWGFCFSHCSSHCLKYESTAFEHKEQWQVKPEDFRKEEAFLWSRDSTILTFYCWANALWETRAYLPALRFKNSWCTMATTHQSSLAVGVLESISVMHYPRVSELLCWQKHSIMTIAYHTHTGLHYRKHSTAESQFLSAMTGFGFIPSSHYL